MAVIERGPSPTTIAAIGAKQAEFLVSAFNEALAKVKEAGGTIFARAKDAEEEQQKFITKACDALLDRINKSDDPVKSKVWIPIYEDMIKASQDAKYAAVEKMAEIYQKTLANELNDASQLIQDAVKVRMELILQEEKKLDIVIKDEQSQQDMELQKKKFEADLKNAAAANKAAILQNQYKLYLDAYNKQMDIAKDILSRHRNVTITNQPPRIDLDANTVTEGWVSCVGSG